MKQQEHRAGTRYGMTPVEGGGATGPSISSGEDLAGADCGGGGGGEKNPSANVDVNRINVAVAMKTASIADSHRATSNKYDQNNSATPASAVPPHLSAAVSTHAVDAAATATPGGVAAARERIMSTGAGRNMARGRGGGRARSSSVPPRDRHFFSAGGAGGRVTDSSDDLGDSSSSPAAGGASGARRRAHWQRHASSERRHVERSS
ncbi:unnamed protein product, partial [Pylaiella littoralis]